MDAIEYDRLCSYVRKTMFRKVKFTLDKALDSVQKGSIGGSASWNCTVEKWKNHGDEKLFQKGQKLYEDNNGIMPSLDEVLLLREEPMWDPEDDNRIVNNTGFLFLVDFIFMYGSIIGKRQWKKDKFISRLSSDMTISDEAFVLL
eukprot:scaffold1693_cov35-Attheya_sp.AAC.1